MKKVLILAKKAGLDGFLLGIIVMILLAYLWPEPGLHEGVFSIQGFANYGVALIFFFYGLRLSPAKLRAGLSNWKLHALIHITTFLLFPLIVLAVRPLFDEGEHGMLWLGTFYMAALPSTVSSSVVMVSIAGGNLPAAIFNASVSSLIGVFLTPVWMGIILATHPGDFDFFIVIGKLIIQVVIPIFFGIFLIPYMGKLAEIHRAKLKYFDQGIILLIVYTSFCESFSQRIFQNTLPQDILILGLLMIGFFFLVYYVVYFVSKALGFNIADTITAVFCSSKKSLVQGTVMSKVLFPENPFIGLILLPIMLYHALQLIFSSIIAQAFARRGGFQKR